MNRFLVSTQNADGTTGLYSSDGTQAGSVNLDLTLYAPPDDSTSFDGKVFFATQIGPVDPSPPTPAIYSTDGAPGGTSVVELNAPGGPFAPSAIATLDGKLLISGNTEFGTFGIWTSANGVDFTQIEDGVDAQSLTVSNGVGYFNAGYGTVNGASTGTPGLWRTDGTASGTTSINPAGVTLDPQAFASAGNGLTVFINRDASGSTSLWVTSGTAQGTHQVVNAALGTDLSAAIGMVSVGGKAFFEATNSAGDYSVWSTDGTSAGTAQIFDGGYALGATRPILSLQGWGDKLVISSGYGVYVSNGTSVTADLLVGAAEGTSTPIVAGNNLFLIPSLSPSSTLYVSDGTVAGTKAVDIPTLASISGMQAVTGNTIIFEGTDTSGKQALFESDGTTAGSKELSLPAGAVLTASSAIDLLPAASGPAPITLGGGAQNYSAPAGSSVLAGSGSDTVLALSGGVTVTGSSGSLTFIGGTGASSVAGGAGQAIIFGGSGGGAFTGGAGGHNILVSLGVAGSNTTLTGAAAGDQIFGSAAGNDLIVAHGGDQILGGGGNTTIDGGGASDVIFTGGGATTVNGGAAGGDTIVGGGGQLAVTAQHGEAIFGAKGGLSVTASTQGADSIIGGAGALAIVGRGANMLVVGATSTSTITTGNGASLIFGATGASTITGGAGSMQVVLGSGNAAITEGSGTATYDVIKGAAGGTDVLHGFKPGSDRIDLFGYSPSQVGVSTAGGSSVISLADGTKIQLLGVTNPGQSIVG